MELKIKAVKDAYALRTYDKNGREIFYTSTRIGGIKFEKDYVKCEVPDESIAYKLLSLTGVKEDKIVKINLTKD